MTMNFKIKEQKIKVMNGLDKKNQQLKEENRELKKKNIRLNREKERYKRLSEIRDENINNRILSLKEFINNCEDEKVKNILEDLFYSEVKEYDLAKENGELKKENEQLKSTNMEMEDYLGRLEESCIISSKRLKTIMNYAKENGEIKYEMLENLFMRGVLESRFE